MYAMQNEQNFSHILKWLGDNWATIFTFITSVAFAVGWYFERGDKRTDKRTDIQSKTEETVFRILTKAEKTLEDSDVKDKLIDEYELRIRKFKLKHLDLRQVHKGLKKCTKDNEELTQIVADFEAQLKEMSEY